MKTAVVILFLYSPFLYSQWQPEVRLTNDPSPSYTSINNARCIASNGNDLHVVWYDYRIGNSSRIFYKHSTDGGINWQADTYLSSVNQTSTNPSVAVSDSVVHVVWEDDRISLSNREIYYRRSTNNGVTWGSEVRLSSLPDDSYESSVSVSGQLVFVVWQDGIWGAWEIYCKRSTDGGTTWGADTRLTNNTGYSASPSTYIYGQTVHLVWSDDSDGNEEIYYKRSTDGGATWAANTRLTNNPAAQRYPTISGSGDNVHIVWFDERDGGGYVTEIYYKKSSDGGINWGTDTRLTNNPGYSTVPSVFASGSAVHVVWGDNRDGNDEIYYKRSADGGNTWDADTRLTNNTAESKYPSLTVSGSALHILWRDRRDGTYPEIYYKQNPIGNTIGITTISSEIPKTFSLSQNYPNPFNPSTNIHFSIPSVGNGGDRSPVRLIIYDMLGREVETLVNEQLNAGTYEVKFEGSHFASGIYFYVLKTEGFYETRKMILIK